jgi:hypothetical protein
MYNAHGIKGSTLREPIVELIDQLGNYTYGPTKQKFKKKKKNMCLKLQNSQHINIMYIQIVSNLLEHFNFTLKIKIWKKIGITIVCTFEIGSLCIA